MRPYLVALLCAYVVLGDLAAASAPGSRAWHLFKSKHGKNYDRDEEAMRFANFLATKQRVDRHNADPSSTYKMRLNHMADWTAEEYQRLNGFKINEAQVDRAPLISQRLAEKLEAPLPKSVDYRKIPNRVSAVKDQGLCGSCWAFATTGLLEGQQIGLNISKLIPLSEQELVDCADSNLGCAGGFIQYALEDIAKLGGMESEADYSYEGKNEACRINKSKFVMNTKGACLLQQGDESALLKAVANYGPVAVSIDATDNFQSYGSGVFTDETCNSKALDHAVLVVGYGSDAKLGDYWIVKNSWGRDWGEAGYIRMKRGVNLCGIAEYATLAHF